MPEITTHRNGSGLNELMRVERYEDKDRLGRFYLYEVFIKSPLSNLWEPLIRVRFDTKMDVPREPLSPQPVPDGTTLEVLTALVQDRLENLPARSKEQDNALQLIGNALKWLHGKDPSKRERKKKEPGN